ncbi:MAG TPA: adventurous gliding motility protein CglF [Myxococcaceae bacterium]|nr:adventurous gliding motility protein CglF [Myxococcaceae bacterium]
MTRFIALLVVLPGLAYADGKKATDENVRYQKTTTINFEDDTIEGDLTRPDGEYVEARKRVKHSNLIRIREEFKDKVMESVGEL